jgi:hypothetical protein
MVTGMDALTRFTVRGITVLLALAVAGCAEPGTGAGSPAPSVAASATVDIAAAGGAVAGGVTPVRPPVAGDVDYRDPARVCARFAAELYSADTVADAGPGDAYQRAAGYMSGALAAQSAAAARDGRWDTWRRQRARLETTAEMLDAGWQPADTAISAARSVLVTAVPVGAGGWRGPAERSVLACDLRRGGPDGDGWRVAHYQVQTAGLR